MAKQNRKRPVKRIRLHVPENYNTGQLVAEEDLQAIEKLTMELLRAEGCNIRRPVRGIWRDSAGLPYYDQIRCLDVEVDNCSDLENRIHAIQAIIGRRLQQRAVYATVEDVEALLQVNHRLYWIDWIGGGPLLFLLVLVIVSSWISLTAHIYTRERKLLDGSPEPLTPRELQVLVLIVAGKTDPEIAEQLVVSPDTASNHVSRIIHKWTLCGVTNRTQAAVYALRSGIVAWDSEKEEYYLVRRPH